MINMVRLFKKSLFSAFYDWLEANKEALGKWYSKLYNEAKNAEDCNTAVKIMGTSMWMFNMAANCGVSAGIGPSDVKIVSIDPSLDEKTTKRLLYVIAACMSLQYLPKEHATKEFPVISSKRFSLKLYAGAK